VSEQREPTLIEYATAAFVALSLAAFAGQLSLWLWFVLSEATATRPSVGLQLIPFLVRSSATRTAMLVVLFWAARRKAHPALLLLAAVALSVVERLGVGVAAWLTGQLSPGLDGRAPGAGPTFEVVARHTLVGLVSCGGITQMSGVALAGWLATLARRTLASGLAVAVTGVAFVLSIPLRSLDPALRIGFLLQCLAYCVAITVLLPLAIRIVPRAFERLGLSGHEEQ